LPDGIAAAAAAAATAGQSIKVAEVRSALYTALNQGSICGFTSGFTSVALHPWLYII